MVFFSQGQQGGHVGGLPEEVHRDNGLGAGGDGAFDGRRVDGHGTPIDVDQNLLETQQGDHFDRCGKGKIGRDHFVAFLQTEGHERYLQRVGAVAAGDDVLYAQVGFEFLLEGRYFRPVDKGAGTHHGYHGGIHFLFDLFILTFQVYHADFLHFSERFYARTKVTKTFFPVAQNGYFCSHSNLKQR